MSDVVSLLPSSSGHFERAIAAGMSDDLPVPYGQIMAPYTAPVEWLPWLGQQHSLDLWFDDWPEARKRESVAQAAGRSVIYPGEELAALKTTREGARRYLALVDATLVDAVSYPAFAICDESFCDNAIVNYTPFLATYLVHVATAEPEAAIVDGAFCEVDFAGETITEPYDRCLKALRTAKSEGTEVRVDFQNWRVVTAGDGFTAGNGIVAGQYIQRTKL